MGEVAEQPQENFVQAIKKVEPKFLKVAKHLHFESEQGFAMALLRNNSYMMQVAISCPSSLAQAMASVADIGLSLNPAKKEAYLITRNIKVKDNDGRERWETRIFLEPSYMGLVNIATNTGSIDWVQARCVYSEDTFIDNGVGEKPTHTYEAFKKDRGEFVGVYCVAKAGDDFLTTVMTVDDVNSIRDRSEAWKRNQSGPWKTDFEEMAKKAVIRNAFKTWPKTDKFSRIEQAVHISNENEGFEPILTSPELGKYTSDQKALFDQYIVQRDSIAMFTLQKTLEESTFTNLYHSFEKGQKGKYQKIVGELLVEGSAKILDCATAIKDAIESGDDFAAMEIAEGMAADTMALIKSHLGPQEVTELSRIMSAQAA